MAEQRNAYRGPLSRPWLRLDFKARDGSVHSLPLVADTASHYALILRRGVAEQLAIHPANPAYNQYGLMLGAWLRLHMPASGLVELVTGYGNDILAAGVAEEDPGFMGLVGLPILRLGQYGGDADGFWFRYPPT